MSRGRRGEQGGKDGVGAQEGDKARAQDEDVMPQALAQQEIGHKLGGEFFPKYFHVELRRAAGAGAQDTAALHGMEDGGSRQGPRAGRAAHQGTGNGTSLWDAAPCVRC